MVERAGAGHANDQSPTAGKTGVFRGGWPRVIAQWSNQFVPSSPTYSSGKL